jgi:hypothetical protein
MPFPPQIRVALSSVPGVQKNWDYVVTKTDIGLQFELPDTAAP